MAFPINDPELRARLDIRPKPYFVRIADRLHLGYRKGKTVSRWVIRRREGGRYAYRTLTGVEPDDRFPADGDRVLDFQQMVERLMTKKSKVSCSFCGKNHKEVAKLVAGPGVFICDACVGLCQIYLDNPGKKGRVLIEDGKAVMKNGKPVFVPLSEDEQKRFDELISED